MKLVFVDNLLFTGSITIPEFDLQPNLGLMSLVAICRQQGVDAEIYEPKAALTMGQFTLDASLYHHLASAICERKPTVVGMTTLGCNFHCVVRVARAIRQINPHIPILLGGPHATILHREILERFVEFHAVVRGEAEETLIEILPRLPKGSLAGIDGVSYRSPDGTISCAPGRRVIPDLDSLPVPAYDTYPIEQLGLATLRVEAGRGCPFSCTFCSTASFFGRNYRLKSPARLRQEMLDLRARYGITDFKLNHDLFTVNRKKVLAFCQEIQSDGFTWGCSARVDCVDEELLIAMQEAGCRSIYFGIESGSERIQKTSRKRLDLSLVKPVLEITERLNIKTTTSFITGFPDEELLDHHDNLNMAGALHVRRAGYNTSQLHLLTPEPGTRLIDELQETLLLDDNISGFNFPRFDPEDDLLLAANRDIFPNHFHYPTILEREQHVSATYLWYQISQLGLLISRYLLKYFDDSFASLADTFNRWRLENRKRGEVTNAELYAFIEAQMYPGHHVLSLLRYSFAAKELRYSVRRQKTIRGRICNPVDPLSEQQERQLVLDEKVRLLVDIHDSVSILGKIEQVDCKLTDAQAGPRANELLLMTDAGLQRFKNRSTHKGLHRIVFSAAQLFRGLSILDGNPRSSNPRMGRCRHAR